MKTKEEIAKYNRIRTNTINRLRNEHYELYRQIYKEEALKVGVKPFKNGFKRRYIEVNPL